MAEKTPIKNPYQVNIMERRHKKALGDEEEEALFYAIKENKVDTVRYLVKQNLNVNHLFFGGAGPKSFWTGLHLCCESGSYECCKVLLEAGIVFSYLVKVSPYELELFLKHYYKLLNYQSKHW